jgi:putative acyl-CoA dehydrogenase
VALVTLETDLAAVSRHQGQARRLVEWLALIVSANLLLRHAPNAVADAFITGRIAGGYAGHFGELPPTVDTAFLARRAVLAFP